MEDRFSSLHAVSRMLAAAVPSDIFIQTISRKKTGVAFCYGADPLSMGAVVCHKPEASLWEKVIDVWVKQETLKQTSYDNISQTKGYDSL